MHAQVQGNLVQPVPVLAMRDRDLGTVAAREQIGEPPAESVCAALSASPGLPELCACLLCELPAAQIDTAPQFAPWRSGYFFLDEASVAPSAAPGFTPKELSSQSTVSKTGAGAAPIIAL